MTNHTNELALAERMLRPSEADMLTAWRAIVTAERMQVESLPNRPRPEDFYAPVAEQFRGDVERTDDPLIARLLELALPGETWLDLGAGGGRYAVPLARRVARVYAVEPSAGMRQVLGEAAQAAGAGNIDVFAERWPGPSAAPVADVGFISHVGYDIAEIGPFLEQLEAHSRRMCVAALFDQAPIRDYAPLWEPVHGEPRVLLPGLREFVALLFARGRPPQLELLSLPGRIFPDLEALQASARRPCWVVEGSREDERLREAVQRLAVRTEEGFRIGPAERRLGIVRWRPTGVTQ